MAKKKTTTKTKKLHPGGFAQNDFMAGVRRQQRGQKNNKIPQSSRLKTPISLMPPTSPAQQRLSRRNTRTHTRLKNEIARAAGFPNARQLDAAMRQMTPSQRAAFIQKHQQKANEITARTKKEYETRNAKLIERVRRQQKGQRQIVPLHPKMPTAGMSQGRPATGRTPMPGPAPDPERMKRFEKLMREQRERLNKLQKPRAVKPRPGPIDPKSVPTLDDLMRTVIKAGRLPAGLLKTSNRPSPRKKPTEAQRRASNDARRRKNRPRTTGLPDAKYS